MPIVSTSRLTVIIVNYFSEVFLGPCLKSLQDASSATEVVIVDNGSQPARRDELQALFPAAKWVTPVRNLGFGKACNLGVSCAGGEHLLFLNPDSIVDPHALAHLTAALDNPLQQRSIIGCRILDPNGATQLSCRSFPSFRTALANRYSLLTKLFPHNQWSSAYLMTDFSHTETRRVDWVSGAAMAMRRQVFEELGGFDEDFFMYLEDVDLCKRAANLGVNVCYRPEIIVTHTIGGSSRHVPIHALAYRHRSIWTYYRKHLRAKLADPFVVGFLVLRFTVLSVGALLRQVFG